MADDTAAIQRAINSFNVQNSTLLGDRSQGGIVHLPRGTYRTTTPLQLKTGITLRGESADTIINSVDSDATRGAIELLPADWNVAYVCAAAVENLAIRTTAAYGVRVRAWKQAVVLQCRFTDLTISSGNWAIYLPKSMAYVQNSYFTRIRIRDMGAGALWVDGNANHIERVCTEGTARSGFQADGAVFRVRGGGNALRDCNVAGVPQDVPTTAYLMSGNGLFFQNNSHAVQTAADGVVYHFTTMQGCNISGLSNLSPQHRVQFTAATGICVRELMLDSGVEVASVLKSDAASAVRVQSVWRQAPPAYTPPSFADYVQPTMNVRDQGVRGDGSYDDTAALQAVVDAAPDGAILYLPRGRYRLSEPIRLRSGLSLVGDGTGTMLFNSDSDATRSAIELTPKTGTTAVQDVLIRDLAIWTYRARAISIGAGLQLTQSKLENLLISAGGWAIDLRNGSSSRNRFSNICNRTMGGGALWVQGDDNLVEGINTEAGVRGNFSADPALLRVGGDRNIIRGNIIEGTPASVATSAYYVTGNNITWEHNWSEIYAARDGISYWFDNVHGLTGDDLHIITTQFRARFTNCSDVTFHVLNLSSAEGSIDQFLLMEGGSSVTVQEVISMFDPGQLDNPNLKIGGFWNNRMSTYVDVGLVDLSPNLLTNGDFYDGLAGWTVQWPPGATGETTVEQIGSTRKLKLTVNSNPIGGKISVTAPRLAASIRGPGLIAYTLDWDVGMFIEPYFNGTTLNTRSHASRTAARLCDISEPIRFLVSGKSGSIFFTRVWVGGLHGSSSLSVLPP